MVACNVSFFRLPDPHRLRSPVVWKSVGGQYLGSGDGCTGSGGLGGCEALQALAMTSYGLDLSSSLSAQEPDFDRADRHCWSAHVSVCVFVCVYSLPHGIHTGRGPRA